MTARGSVRANAPRVAVKLFGRAASATRPAVVDTGFALGVAAPADLLRRIGLESTAFAAVTLADGTPRSVPATVAGVRVGESDRVVTEILFLPDGTDVLIGMDLLHDHRLTLDAVEGGPVTIAPLSQSSPDTP